MYKMNEKLEKRLKNIHSFMKDNEISSKIIAGYMGYSHTYVVHVIAGIKPLSERFMLLLEAAIKKYCLKLKNDIEMLLKDALTE